MFIEIQNHKNSVGRMDILTSFIPFRQLALPFSVSICDQNDTECQVIMMFLDFLLQVIIILDFFPEYLAVIVRIISSSSILHPVIRSELKFTLNDILRVQQHRLPLHLLSVISIQNSHQQRP